MKKSLLSICILCLVFLLIPGIMQPSSSVRAAGATSQANWVQAGFNRERTSYNPFEATITSSNVTSLTPAWSFYYDSSGSPIENNGILYFSSPYTGVLYAVNTATGATIWIDRYHGNYGSTPAIANGILYSGTASGTLYAVNALTDKLIWGSTVGASLDTDSLWANGTIYIGSQNGRLYAFNATSGKILWSFLTNSSSLSDAATDASLVYVDSGGTLYALNGKTGKLVWRYAVQGSPVIANGLVYIGTSEMIALNEMTGKLVWVNATIQSTGAVAATSSAVFSAGNGFLYAVNAHTGHLLWTSSEYASGLPYGYEVSSSPVVANGIVYVGGLDYNGFYATEMAFSVSTGTLLWFTYNSDDYDPDSEGAGTTPIVVNGMLFFETPEPDGMYAFHLPV